MTNYTTQNNIGSIGTVPNSLVTEAPVAKSGGFCDTPFWDASLSWWSTPPDITPCFQFSIIRLIPCLWFCMVLPVKYFKYRWDRQDRLRDGSNKGAAMVYHYSSLTITKITICAILAIVSIGEVGQSTALYVSQVAIRPASQFLSPIIELLTVIGVAFIIRFERLNGYLACGALWLYWLWATLCYVIVGYSAILNYRLTFTSTPADGSASANLASRWKVDLCVFVLTIIRFTANLISFGLACVADHEVDKTKLLNKSFAAEFGDRESPELAAGFLSRLIYSWMFPIIRRGATNSLEPKDLCSLNPIDLSSANAPLFENVHSATVSAWRKKQGEPTNVNGTNGSLKRGRKRGKAEAEAEENPKLALVIEDDEGDKPLVDKETALNGGNADEEDVKSPLNGHEEPKKRFTVTNGEKTNQSGRRAKLMARRGKAKNDAAKNNDPKAQKPKSEFELDQTKYPSALKSLLKVYWKDLARAHACKAIQDVVIFTNTALVGALINFADDPQRSNYAWKGALFAFGLAANSLIQSISFQRTFHIGMRCGMHMRTAVTTALYRKSLTISNNSRAKATLGELVNLMAVDAQRLQDFFGYSWAFWSCPEQIIVASVLIWTQMGVATLAGLATMILFVMPLNAFVATRQRKLQADQMRYKDERIKLVNELLAGVRLVKLYAWEIPFCRRVTNIRDQEISLLRKSANLGVIQSFIFTFAPYLVTVVTFAVYVASSDQELTAARAFVTLNLFQILRFPMGILPMIIQMGVVTMVAIKRISRFLAQQDLDEASVSHELNEAEPITLDDASFGWSASAAQQESDASKTNDKATQQAVLRNVTLRVQRGELLAIVGRVGAGKSTLVSAILGETELIGGRVNVSGRVAYVAQQSWIQNASLRDNVLFGSEYDEAKYKRVVAACALEADLAMLPGGDQTEIGEKGINLSGGQKQRVALARAVYADADIYLLDDPLSAVDVHVGRHIFEQVVGARGLLRKKTRVFVTHGLHWLRGCDRVAVLDSDSKRVVQLGRYEDLIAEQDSFILNHLHLESDREAAADGEKPEEAEAGAEKDASKLDNNTSLVDISGEKVAARHASTSSSEYKRGSADVTVSSVGATPNRKPALKTQMSMTREQEEEAIRAAVQKQEEQKLIQEEKSATGSVKFSVYLAYFRSQSLALFLIYALMQALVYGLFILANWWLSLWTEDKRLTDEFGANSCASLGNSTNSSLVFSTTTFTPVPFSTSTVSTVGLSANGTCWNKTDRDALRGFYLLIYGVIGIVIAVVTLIAAVLNAIGTVRASRVLHASMLDRILHAPMRFFDTTPTGRIMNRFSKDIDLVDNALPFTFRSWLQTALGVFFTVIGVAVGTPLALAVVVPAAVVFYLVQRFFIPTTRQLKRLESTSKSPVFTHFSESLQGRATIRAFGVRDRFVAESELRTDRNNVYCFLGLVATRWIGMYLDFISTLFITGAAAFCVGASLSDMTTGGRVGLSLTYALTIAQTLNWMIRMNNEMEMNVVSVERIQEYAQIEQEPEWERTEAELLKDEIQLSNDWPEQGTIELDAYATRYRENLDLVLRDVSVRVGAGEKIGIVGRTGAGKSSFTLALFRMIEAVRGRITIDGIDVAKLGVHQLRSKLTILPQDPVIFAGSLRSNLDPFDAYTDEQVWRALELADLKTHFESSGSGGLAYECSEGGSNLSVGQRQLLCLARALLRKTKVLILDEATAAVDVRTDELIQRTIRTAFADCTVVTIAHRLNTVIDYDRILVLDRGEVVEYDSPAALIGRPGSVFAEMVRQSSGIH